MGGWRTEGRSRQRTLGVEGMEDGGNRGDERRRTEWTENGGDVEERGQRGWKMEGT